MSTREIRMLRRKFILIAEISFAVVMLFMGGLIYTTNLLMTRSQIRSTMQTIVENNGDMPEFTSSESTVAESESASSDSAVSSASEAAESEGVTYDEDVIDEQNVTYSILDIFSQSSDSKSNSELRYSTRYFAVIFDSDYNTLSVKTNHIASVDQDDAVSLALYATQRAMSFGNFGNYYYLVSTLDNGEIMVVYMDCSSQVMTNMRILYIAGFLCIAGLIISVLLLSAISNRIVAPEIENAKRQKQFITNASHELKTPLAVIRANTELEEMINGETEWSQSTMRQIDRLNGLIQNLVMISRSAEQNDDAIVTDVDFTKIADETAETFTPVATQDGKRFEKQIGENIRMRGDESQLRQLISLLLDNAIKYCDDDGLVRIMLSKKGRTATLIVSNTYAEGADINYSRFFDRFYREDQSHNVDQGGYGIGLSIAESLVHQYKGSINATWKAGMISFTCVLNDKL